MQLGMIGLGRMGSNMVRRLLRGGHECVAYDHQADAVRALTKEGAAVANRIPDIAPDVLNDRLNDFTKAELTELRRLLRKFIGD